MISGRGSNLQSVLDSFDPLNIVLVVSSQMDALGKLKAKRYGIPVLDFCFKKTNWDEFSNILKERKVEGLFLAGFMKIIPQFVLDSFQNRIVNIHPSLLPLFPGLNSFEKALQSQAQTGVSVHFVDAGIDTGQIIKQKKLSRIYTLGERRLAQMELTFTERYLATAVLRQHWSVPVNHSGEANGEAHDEAQGEGQI
jgi:phosphoribosylglycinamide formyltransferase-1